MGKQHNVVVPGPDGQPATYRMKQWLRRNPGILPEGVDADSATSHQLRAALRGRGWRLVELDDQVLVIQPTRTGDTSYAEELVAEGIREADSLSDEEIEEAAELSFGLERDLQDALRGNIAQLEQGLTIEDSGKELLTEAGRTDILAEDRDANLVAIELKAGSALPEAITQILAYMTAIGEERNRRVRGILVARDFPKRVLLAARSIPNLQLKTYGFRFSFQDA
jgi:hypothetical protein